jgi:hypothetical protein
MWDNILNWKLLRGSHEFPGPAGGTCINEAAIVAAGFEYREVRSAADCPPCFSRVIAGYAIRLNDSMPRDLRQELLMPFVLRLAGTADADDVETRRAGHIAIETIKRILPISLRAIGLEDHARRCEQADDLTAAKAAAHAAGYAASISGASGASAVASAASGAAAYAGAAHAAHAAADAYAANTAFAPREEFFRIAVAILDEAIKLGNQAEPIEMPLVVSRMETMKQSAPENSAEALPSLGAMI